MDNATRNAGDMFNALTIKMNRTRQAQIAKVLIVLISGAEAPLKEDRAMNAPVKISQGTKRPPPPGHRRGG